MIVDDEVEVEKLVSFVFTVGKFCFTQRRKVPQRTLGLR